MVFTHIYIHQPTCYYLTLILCQWADAVSSYIYIFRPRLAKLLITDICQSRLDAISKVNMLTSLLVVSASNLFSDPINCLLGIIQVFCECRSCTMLLSSENFLGFLAEPWSRAAIFLVLVICRGIRHFTRCVATTDSNGRGGQKNYGSCYCNISTPPNKFK